MKRAGMMRSVSMSSPGTYTARPVTELIFASAMVVFVLSARAGDTEDFTRVGDAAADRSGGDHHRAHQHGAPRGAALSSLEVAVRRRRAQLAADQLVGVHGQAHRAARLSPLEARLSKDGVEPFRLGGARHRHRARN